MADVLHVTPDSNGRAIVTVHGDQYDVTELADEDGKGFLELYGETYEFEILKSGTQKRNKRSRKTKTEGK